MSFSEQAIFITATLAALLILVFMVDWRHFRDWVVVFLFICVISLTWGSPLVEQDLIDYPVRLLPQYYDTNILFELWVFPVLCVWYNQVTRQCSLPLIFCYALLFSAGIVAIEYPLELYTNLIKYKEWSWFTSFYTLMLTFLTSRAFIAFYRWGCDYFGGKARRY
ncbi:MAG: hypothetical protein N2491_10300 [Negativicutes bacterium]|nr:hypothetical protein [Negativicutes bacterium]